MEPAMGGFFKALCAALLGKKAVEKLTDKAINAVLSLLGPRLKAWILGRLGRDAEARRLAAFHQAVQHARQNTLSAARDPERAEQILNALQTDLDPEPAAALAEEAKKFLLLSDAPDDERLRDVLQTRLHWDAIWREGSPPPVEAVTEVLKAFLGHLSSAMLDQRLLYDRVPARSMHIQEELLREVRPVPHADEAEYRLQVARRYRELDFIGIPETKENRPITLDPLYSPAAAGEPLIPSRSDP